VVRRLPTAPFARPLSTELGLHLPLSTLKEDESMMMDMVGSFARDIVGPKVKQMDETSTMDPEIISALFEQGLMGIEIPEEYGGTGASFTTSCLCIEELSKVDPAVGTCVDVHNTVVNNTIGFWGSEDLKAEFFPKLATEYMGSFCLSEPGSGSDAFSLATKAEVSKDGSEYKINGNKLWITNAQHAGVFLCFANVDHSLGYKGITCFVVPADTPGVEVGPHEDKLGIRASSTCPVTFNDVVVPKKYVLGKIGHGYKYAIGILNEGRIGIGAQMVGLAQGAFDSTMPYLFERTQFGTPIGDFQGMEMQYADIAMEIEAARMLVYNAARMKESGEPFIKEAAMAKLKASLVAEATASKCIEWLGGIGFTKDYPAEKFYRDCKIGQIYEGTSNIQRVTIAKFLKAPYR
jgi:alkylation response protein AidB-like acyl-CoA dehydrogenase